MTRWPGITPQPRKPPCPPPEPVLTRPPPRSPIRIGAAHRTTVPPFDKIIQEFRATFRHASMASA